MTFSRTTLFTVTLLALSACASQTVSPDAQNNPEISTSEEGAALTEESPPEESEMTITNPPHPVSIDALIEKDITGSDFTIGQVLAENEAYTRYYITYKSGELTISGIMNVPKEGERFPLLILNHGYIDPAVYTNGRGLKREQDYLAQRGYVVVHTDYRNHAESDDDPDSELWFRLGYAEDAMNVVHAIRASNIEFIDTERVGMLGHSMGGGVTLNSLVIDPELVNAAVLFAPVSADYRRNFEKWTKQRTEVAEKIVERYGLPEEAPEFWDGISAKNYFGRITVPIQIHHGSIDESVPLEWSDELAGWLSEAGVQHEYFVYENQLHEFIRDWPLVMERTAEFFDGELKWRVK